jgi:DnaK suppressor protein
MAKRNVEQLRRVLEAKVIEFEGSARQRDAIVIDVSADMLDRGLRASEREIAARNLDAASAKRREARAALRRIQEGTYGFCLHCEEAISPARLAALPWAALCLRCQEAADRRREVENPYPAFGIAA